MRGMQTPCLRYRLLALLLLFCTTPAWARDCLLDTHRYQSETSTARIVRVSDGDTVVLENNQKVRLIGFNTLELNSQHPPMKYWAQRAADELELLVLKRNVLLTKGRDSTDRYNRVLAHVQLEDGTDIAQVLIERGLAFAVAVGRNTRCSSQNSRLEAKARTAATGFWAVADNWINRTHPLKSTNQGFQIVHSRIADIKGKGKQRYLLLDNGLRAKLGKHWPLDRAETSKLLTELRGQTIEVRGWLGRSNGALQLTVHHPDNIQAFGN